jgi:DNA-binding response OmpR family regulator
VSASAAHAPASFHILVIEDDALLRGVICDTLSSAGFQVSRASGMPQALLFLRVMAIDLVVVGPVASHFLDSRGQMLSRFRSAAPGVPVVTVPADSGVESPVLSGLATRDPFELLPRVQAAINVT